MPTRKLSSTGIAGVVALAVFTVFITWCAKQIETRLVHADETPSLVGKSAPEFSLQSLDRGQVSLADYRGKKVVVSFWASWCGPCRLEMPELRSFYQRYHKNSDKFEFLAISLDENRGDAASFAIAEKLPFPVLLDPNSEAAKAFGVTGIPTMFVVDESGKIAFGHIGYDATVEILLAHELHINITPGSPGVTVNEPSR